jgi:hypothetical protein
MAGKPGESSFPLPKLRQYIYSTLDVLMYIDYLDAIKFMFEVSKEGRYFLESNFTTIHNGFTNEGLIPFEFDCTFDGCL